MSRSTWLVPLVALPAMAILCDPQPTTLRWYTTCGDPVCHGYDGPFTGVPVCGSQAEGDVCSSGGATCDLVDDCNTRLICAEDDPKSGPGGCPISRSKYKRDVRYLDPAATRAAATELLDTKLATWRYTWEADDARPHLGFLIDDQPGSAAVQADGDHVDLYGYTSLTVAAIQAQQAEIEALRAEMTELKARCGP